MSHAKDFLVTIDTPAVQDFRVKYGEYVKTLSTEEMYSLIKEHPGEGWRVLLIERSGLDLPEEIRLKVEEYKSRQIAHQAKLDKVRMFMDSEEYQEMGHVFVKYKMWHCKFYCKENLLSLYELKMLIQECLVTTDVVKESTPLEKMIAVAVAVE